MYDMRDKGTCDQVQRADAPWAHKAFVVLCLPGSDRVCSDLNNVLQEEHPPNHHNIEHAILCKRTSGKRISCKGGDAL